MNKFDLLGILNEGAYGIVYKAKNKEAPESGILLHSHFRAVRDQKVQGNGRRRDRAQNDASRGQNVENAEAREHRATKRSIQKVHRKD